MPAADLLYRVCQTIQRYLALGNESFDAHVAPFVRNRATPSRYDANHVGLIRADDPAEIDAMLQQADAEYEGMGHRRFDIDALTPPQIEGRLALDSGYSRWDGGLHLVLEGELNAKPEPPDIREVSGEDDWSAYTRLMEMWFAEDARKYNRTFDAGALPERMAYARAKMPAVRFWLAYVKDQPVAFLNSWPGENGVGQVEDLFTYPDYRHQGLATALIAHCVADARARGAGPVVITAEPDDTPKQMYAAMGFRPFCVSRHYVKRL